jgi:peptidase E
VKNTIHLIGGGPSALLATRRHIKHAVKSLDKKRPLVAYVGVASNDNLGFQKMVSALFVGTGARIEMPRIARKNASMASARRLLDGCDLVFMSGGDVEHGMNVLRERGVDGDLKRLAAAGKPFLGISAGSIMTCQEWVRFPDENDDSSAEPFPCLGIAPLHMDAHSEDDGWSELRVLVRVLARKRGEALGYGVPSKGCLRVELDGGKPTLAAMGAPIARLAARDDKTIVEKRPLAPNA